MKSYYTNIIETEFMFQERAYIGRVPVTQFYNVSINNF